MAKEAWRRASRALGTALIGLVNLLNPDTILLTGGLAKGAPLFLPDALKRMVKCMGLRNGCGSACWGATRNL